MGNKQERRLHRNFSISEWEFVECLNGFGLFRNRITGQHCEEYLLKVTSEKDKLMYQKRKSKCQEHLVNILHCQVFTNFDQHYALVDFTVRVFLERIPVRLQEIAQLPIDAIPLLIFESLLGFKKIFEDFEAVQISPEMIGFTESKEVRVWLSPNFLENFPQTNSTAACEQTMVDEIFNIFDRYSDLYSRRPELGSFTQALEYIAQIPSINKSHITLVKVPTEPSMNKPLSTKSDISIKQKLSIGSRENELSPQPRRHIGKMFETVGSKHRLEIEIPSEHRYVVQTVDRTTTGHAAFTGGIPNQKIHQRQISTVTSQFQQTQAVTRTQSQTDSRKNLTMMATAPNKTMSQKMMTIGIESARTTSNAMPLYDNFIELDNKGLQLELLDDKKSKETKLHMIEDVLIDHKDDSNVRKVCKVYNYAIKFDPLMYHELQKAKGRISKISNQYVLRKLIQVSEQEDEEEPASPLNSESYTSASWAKIKTDQQLKNSSFMKVESQERIKQILAREKVKRGEDHNAPKKIDKNKTFFGSPKEQKIPKKTAMEMSQATFAKPRGSEVASSHPQSNQDMSKRRATAFEPGRAEDAKKAEKREMMETFKKEFDKLFEF